MMKAPYRLVPMNLPEVWAGKRLAQVKEGFAQRAGDTEQSVWLLKLLVLTTSLLCGTAQALDLNLATEADLDGVKGLGPSTTARILAAREQRPFKDWNDFTIRVKGVKSATAGKLSGAGVTIDGAAYFAPAPASSASSASPPAKS